MLVIDTNIWVSYALNRKGAVGQSLQEVLLKHAYAFSEATFRELADVITREKFSPYFSIDSRLKILHTLANNAEWFTPQITVTDCRDPEDNKFLELAVEARATHLITGDQDLLILHPFRGIFIQTLGDFCKFR